MAASFFPFHPRRLRTLLAGGAVVALALGAWAGARSLTGAEPLVQAEARAGLCAGLMLAFIYVWYRLRPRPGWGVSLLPLTLVISRPLSGQWESAWSRVREVRRTGSRRDSLLVLFEDERRWVVPGQLFPDAASFEEMARAVEERVPRGSHDA